MSDILIMEDDEEMARMLEFVLGDSFDQIEVCTTQTDAIHQARDFLSERDPEDWPDVFILDLLINGEDGLDLYEWMKEQNGGEIPDHSTVIWLTGCHPKSSEFESIKETEEIVCEKDHFSAQDIREKVEAVVDAKAA